MLWSARFCTDLQPCNIQPHNILNVTGLVLNLFWSVMGSKWGKHLLQSLSIVFNVMSSTPIIVRPCYGKITMIVFLQEKKTWQKAQEHWLNNLKLCSARIGPY